MLSRSSHVFIPINTPGSFQLSCWMKSNILLPPSDQYNQFKSKTDSTTWWRHQWKHLPRYWPFVRGIHRSPVNYPHTKTSHAELWCFLWSAPGLNGWVNSHEACDLRRHRAHHDVIVMLWSSLALGNQLDFCNPETAITWHYQLNGYLYTVIKPGQYWGTKQLVVWAIWCILLIYQRPWSDIESVASSIQHSDRMNAGISDNWCWKIYNIHTVIGP